MARKLTLKEQIGTSLNFFLGQKDLSVVIFVMAILAIIIVPLPSVVLDILLTVSMSIAILILLISLYIPKPTDLTTFPTLILIITLFRLSLNVATTRMILSHGNEGPQNVSSIITSFGDFVVGGNFVIGIIVFSILVLINFMVITKGSTRVAEVAARFVLDSMPGKQMAVDADLNSGLIDDTQAKQRRAEILQDANFYGAMDGSSKFVKGDAVAGIVITLINIIGGFLIGVFQHDMSVSQSAATFTLLTIGDGLVGQIPALIISTATGIMITRSSGDGDNFAEGTINQMMGNSKIMMIVGFIMILFALVPGLPTASMGFVGIIFALLGWSIYKFEKGELSILDVQNIVGNKSSKELQQEKAAQKPKKTEEEIAEEEENALEDILKVEMLELTLGYQLIRLADASQGGDLLERIRSMRRKIASDFGFLMPQVRIRDNLHLAPQQYQILLKGVSIGEGEIMPDKFLAMDSGMATGEINGEATKEPAFGLDALWIDPELKEDAIINGDTSGTFDADTVANIDSRLAWDGLRIYAHKGSYDMVDLSTFSTSNLLAMRSLMGKYGVNPNKLAWIVSVKGYSKFLSLPETMTMDKYGPKATILTGEQGKFLGSPIIVSEAVREDLNDTGVYDGTTTTYTEVILVYTPAFVLGTLKDVRFEPYRDPSVGNRLYASIRADFQPRFDSEPTCVIGVKVS